MHKRTHTQLNLLLLLSLLLVILLFPALDHGEIRRLTLAFLLFAPVILATVRLAEKKHWAWPGILLATVTILATLASLTWPTRLLLGFKWCLLALFFALSVAGLFSYLKNARSVSGAHLYTAVSIYLMLGLQWFAIYMAIDVISPGAFQNTGVGFSQHQSALLYFSLVTLSTIGYGDVLPVHGEARMLAALEGITGILYVAITVALLVSAYRHEDRTQ